MSHPRREFGRLRWCGIELVLPASSTEWRLSAPVRVWWDEPWAPGLTPEEVGVTLTGTTTDFASVPRLLRGVVSKVGLHTRAAIVHDALYRRPENRRVLATVEVPSPTHHHEISRRDADDLLRAIARQSGASRVTAWMLWRAVRLFGRRAWQQPAP